MSRSRKRVWVVLGVGMLAVPLGAAAIAYGCTAIASLSPSPGSAPPGSTVTVTGKYFKDTHQATNTPEPVEIRLGSLTGQVLATAAPAGPAGTFTVPVTVPNDVAPGDTFLSATQNNADGTPAYGTPARQPFTVLPASGGDSAAPTNLPSTVGRLLTPTLTMSSARRNARRHIQKRVRGAKRVRASCKRRSRTSAVCMVRWTKGSRAFRRRMLVKS